jgi:hypothetical protein
MGTSCEIHTQAALSPRKNTRYPQNRRLDGHRGGLDVSEKIFLCFAKIIDLLWAQPAVYLMETGGTPQWTFRTGREAYTRLYLVPRLTMSGAVLHSVKCCVGVLRVKSALLTDGHRC